MGLIKRTNTPPHSWRSVLLLFFLDQVHINSVFQALTLTVFLSSTKFTFGTTEIEPTNNLVIYWQCVGQQLPDMIPTVGFIKAKLKMSPVFLSKGYTKRGGRGLEGCYCRSSYLGTISDFWTCYFNMQLMSFNTERLTGSFTLLSSMKDWTVQDIKNTDLIIA